MARTKAIKSEKSRKSKSVCAIERKKRIDSVSGVSIQVRLTNNKSSYQKSAVKSG